MDLPTEYTTLEESLVDRVIAMEDLGWTKISGANFDDDGLDLSTLKRISRNLRELTGTHPLFTRGDQLRNAYVFGRGMSFIGIDKPKRVQELVDNPNNQSTIFGVDAYEVANRALFTDGLFCVIRNVHTNRFIQVPLSQISEIVTNPDDGSDWWYIMREWSANSKNYKTLIPLARHFQDDPRKSIKDESGKTIQVNPNYRAYVKHTKRQSGWAFGVPDSLAGMIHALAYTGYLGDQATLVHALSKFAWNITSTSSRRTEQIKTRMQTVGGDGSVGSASIGNQVSGVGVPSAQVNFNNGQPLAALVAASFGVPVIALLSSPGATGGSYGAAQTLDAPTLKGFEVIQNSWVNFYRSILQDMGAKNADVGFASIESDPAYRQVSSLTQAHEVGGIWLDEYREAVMDLLDIEVKHDAPMPEPPLMSGVSAVSKQGNPADGAAEDTTNPGGDTNNDGNVV